VDNFVDIETDAASEASWENIFREDNEEEGRFVVFRMTAGDLSIRW
jgi:hypothetical protein